MKTKIAYIIVQTHRTPLEQTDEIINIFDQQTKELRDKLSVLEQENYLLNAQLKSSKQDFQILNNENNTLAEQLSEVKKLKSDIVKNKPIDC